MPSKCLTDMHENPVLSPGSMGISSSGEAGKEKSAEGLPGLVDGLGLRAASVSFCPDTEGDADFFGSFLGDPAGAPAT